jgi:hypothetical protein
MPLKIQIAEPLHLAVLQWEKQILLNELKQVDAIKTTLLTSPNS